MPNPDPNPTLVSGVTGEEEDPDPSATTALAPRRSRGIPRYRAGGGDAEINAYAIRLASKAEAVDQDPIVQALQRPGADSLSVLRLIRLEIAKEAASIQYHRQECERAMDDKASIHASLRRIQALLNINAVESDIYRLGGISTIDVRSEKFAKVMEIWVANLKEVAQEVIPKDKLDVFFIKLQSAMQGWEDRVEEALKS